MRVVVAGGAGFLGACLVDRLQAEGDEVIVVDDLSQGHLANLAEARRRGGVRFHRMDVAQGGLVPLAERLQADAWVHLAQSTNPVRAWEDPTADGRSVVAGGIEVLRAAAVSGARLVVASSGAYLHPLGVQGGRTRVTDPPRPTHPFGAGRLALEAYVNAYAARGLAAVVVVLGTVYGPRQDPRCGSLVARTAWAVAQGKPPRVEGDGRQRRDFVFVDDAVDALARAVRSSCCGRVLVGTGVPTSVIEVVEWLAREAGWVGEPEWAPERPGDPRCAALDPAHTAKVLGWEPWTRLDEGLGLTLEWVQSQLPRPRSGH